jgi:CRISPR system Cascade subunit CasA
MKKFLLLYEPWIPVLRNGRIEEIGLEQVLLDAHNIVRIDTPSPLEEATLHRLLLAVLHRALEGPKRLEDALELWRKGRFPDDPIRAYLSRYRERFFLFHPEAPFLQVADLPEKPAPMPWTKLVPELASGNNSTLSDYNTDEDPSRASYAQAARALLAHQAFAVSGTINRLGVTSGTAGPLASAAVFLPTGDTLFQTLLFNLVPYSTQDFASDAPIWEQEPLMTHNLTGGRKEMPFSGRTRVYTWLSRAVRFLDTGDGVQYMAYGPGVKPEATQFRDPMLAYTGGIEAPAPWRLLAERSFWRDLDSMLHPKTHSMPATLEHANGLLSYLADDKEEDHLALRVIGQVLDQRKRGKVLAIRREVYPIPRGALTALMQLKLNEAVRKANDLGSKLSDLAQSLARDVLGPNRRDAASSLARSLPLERLYWFSLDASFPEFLQKLGENGATEFWLECICSAARHAWASTRISLGTQARHLASIERAERRFQDLMRNICKERKHEQGNGLRQAPSETQV